MYQPSLLFHYQCIFTGVYLLGRMQKIVGEYEPSLKSPQCGLEEKLTSFDRGVTQCLDIYLCERICTALRLPKMSKGYDVLCISYDLALP